MFTTTKYDWLKYFMATLLLIIALETSTTFAVHCERFTCIVFKRLCFIYISSCKRRYMHYFKIQCIPHIYAICCDANLCYDETIFFADKTFILNMAGFWKHGITNQWITYALFQRRILEKTEQYYFFSFSNMFSLF